MSKKYRCDVLSGNGLLTEPAAVTIIDELHVSVIRKSFAGGHIQAKAGL